MIRPTTPAAHGSQGASTSQVSDSYRRSLQLQLDAPIAEFSFDKCATESECFPSSPGTVLRPLSTVQTAVTQSRGSDRMRLPQPSSLEQPFPSHLVPSGCASLHTEVKTSTVSASNSCTERSQYTLQSSTQVTQSSASKRTFWASVSEEEQPHSV